MDFEEDDGTGVVGEPEGGGVAVVGAGEEGGAGRDQARGGFVGPEGARLAAGEPPQRLAQLGDGESRGAELLGRVVFVERAGAGVGEEDVLVPQPRERDTGDDAAREWTVHAVCGDRG